MEIEEARLGRTFLVFYEPALVAYYTLSNDSLRVEYLPRTQALTRPVENRDNRAIERA